MTDTNLEALDDAELKAELDRRAAARRAQKREEALGPIMPLVDVIDGGTLTGLIALVAENRNKLPDAVAERAGHFLTVANGFNDAMKSLISSAGADTAVGPLAIPPQA